MIKDNVSKFEDNDNYVTTTDTVLLTSPNTPAPTSNKGGNSPSGGCDVGFGFMAFAFVLPWVAAKRR